MRSFTLYFYVDPDEGRRIYMTSLADIIDNAHGAADVSFIESCTNDDDPDPDAYTIEIWKCEFETASDYEDTIASVLSGACDLEEFLSEETLSRKIPVSQKAIEKMTESQESDSF